MARKKRIKAVSYLRVSGKGQVRGHGFTRQREAIAAYAKAAGFEVVEEFQDKGVSGTRELEDREGLAKLIDRISSNGIRAVLVERADRVARDLLIGEVILGQMRELGVTVFTSEGDELTAGDDDPTRALIRQVLGAVAQFEKSTIVLKLRAARERMRRTKGRCEGRKPFGFHPGEARTLVRMKGLRRKKRNQPRLGYKKIADTLNAEGHATRQGKPWQAMTVKTILDREAVR